MTMEPHNNPTRDDVDRFLNILTQSEATRTTYRGALLRWFDYLGDRPATRTNAQEWLDQLKLAGRKENTVATNANAIRRLFRWLTGVRIALDAPGNTILDPRYQDPQKIALMVEWGSPLERAVTGLLFLTACRISEIVTLRLEDIDWDQNLLEVTRKGGVRRSMYPTGVWLCCTTGSPPEREILRRCSCPT